MGESAVLKIALSYNLRRQCRFDGKTKTKIECTVGWAAKGALVGKKLYKLYNTTLFNPLRGSQVGLQ